MHQRGLVLIQVLMTAVFIAWGVLSMLESSVLLEKASGTIQRLHDDLYQMEQVAKTIVDFDLWQEEKRCSMKKPCEIEHRRQSYQYGLKYLGKFEDSLRGKNHHLHHWLVTVIKSDRSFIQLRVATALDDVSLKKFISWRWLPMEKAFSSEA